MQDLFKGGARSMLLRCRVCATGSVASRVARLIQCVTTFRRLADAGGCTASSDQLAAAHWVTANAF
jgi:hypothetical protein